MNESPSVLVAKESITLLPTDMVDRLKAMARNAPLKRSRFCLHLSHEDAVQEMVIVLHRDTYIRPHRHEGKTESFHMIDGAVLVAFFDDLGIITRTVRLEAGLQQTFLYRLSSHLWHSVVPLTEFAVFHEVTTGPFSPSEFPAWEPENTPKAIQFFKERILNLL